ncbi:hypothetical protein HYW17_00160 [Candidatus Uhrbacteria bacterium]|nr:hypothetical protein [Candidatus Uhrbacteria bacterium]
MGTLKVGDKLIYCRGEKGYFELLEDPHWAVKILAGGLSFFMGSPERTRGGIWDCPGLKDAQAIAIMRMAGNLGGLKMAVAFDDEEHSGGPTCLFDGKVQGGSRRSGLYRCSALLRCTPDSQHSRFELSRIAGSPWRHALGSILSLGLWSPEDECREVVASWHCPGLGEEQAAAAARMIADLFCLRASRVQDPDAPKDVLFAFEEIQRP